MPWTEPTILLLRPGEIDVELCTCTRLAKPHEATHRLLTRHVNADTGELGEERALFLCTNAAAAVAHSRGIKHPCFNPEGAKSAPPEERRA